MTSLEYNSRFLSEAVPQLEEYLLSKELYWPLNGSLPRLTLGALLLTLRREQVTTPLDPQEFETKVNAIHTKWRSAWDKKVGREKNNRINLWGQYLSDYLAVPEQRFESYKTEVRGRVILQLLETEVPDFQFDNKLSELDRILKLKLLPGGFLWENKFVIVFPINTFWFLYGTI